MVCGKRKRGNNKVPKFNEIYWMLIKNKYIKHKFSRI